MVRNLLLVASMLLSLLGAASCDGSQPVPEPEQSLGNPASVYCEEQGGTLEFRQDATGGTAGICLFSDGSECDEWAYYRNECNRGDSLAAPEPTASPAIAALEATATPETAEGSSAATLELASDGCRVYRNTELGFSFHYPADTAIGASDNPLRSITVGPETPGESWPAFSISHPADRAEYRPPEGADLQSWLADHNLVGEVRMPDVQIAGTTAIRYRHERSPQSYADDRYYLAHDGQLYMILIGHVDDREEWDVYDHFLASFQFDAQS
jgi:putative hemolysin